MQSIPKSQTEQIRSGDRGVFDRLHADLAPRVRGYLQRLTGGNRAAAEDLTQDVFVAAYVGRERYSGGARPLGWLMGIARRRWRDSQRSAPPLAAELLPDRAGDADLAAQVVRAAHLEACLNRLDPAAREAILLVFGEGRTYAEAAAILAQPVGTVKWRVHAASRTLRELLQAAEREELP